MLEIDITEMLEKDLINYSASCSELGQDAGKITWENALNADFELVTDSVEILEVKRYFEEFGAWVKEEIEAWNNKEVNALLVQFVAGALRRYMDAKEEGPDRFQEYQESEGGEIFEHGNKYYYLLSA